MYWSTLTSFKGRGTCLFDINFPPQSSSTHISNSPPPPQFLQHYFHPPLQQFLNEGQILSWDLIFIGLCFGVFNMLKQLIFHTHCRCTVSTAGFPFLRASPFCFHLPDTVAVCQLCSLCLCTHCIELWLILQNHSEYLKTERIEIQINKRLAESTGVLLYNNLYSLLRTPRAKRIVVTSYVS